MPSEMNTEEGILEILLVSAAHIRNPNFIGNPCYYVIAHCGKQELRSKTVSGEHKKAVWNEKLVLRFPFSHLENMAHLKLRIMDTSTFSNVGNFIGETTIHLGGVITEGTDKGFVELKPAPYKVVLEDDRYKGEIKIGLKFKKISGMVFAVAGRCANNNERMWQPRPREEIAKVDGQNSSKLMDMPKMENFLSP